MEACDAEYPCGPGREESMKKGSAVRDSYSMCMNKMDLIS